MRGQNAFTGSVPPGVGRNAPAFHWGVPNKANLATTSFRESNAYFRECQIQILYGSDSITRHEDKKPRVCGAEFDTRWAKRLAVRAATPRLFRRRESACVPLHKVGE